MSSLELAFEGQNSRSLQGVRTERFPKIHIHRDFMYERFNVNRRNYWYLRFKALPFEDELGYDGFRKHDEVRHNIRPGAEVIFVRPARGRDVGKDIGFVTHEIRDNVLVTGIKVILRDYRGKGIGRHLAEFAILSHDVIGATGRTRRGEVLSTYSGLEYQRERLFKYISPIDTNEKLTPEARQSLSEVLTPKEREGLNFENGLYPDGTYPRINDPRFFRAPRSNPDAVRISNALRELGIDPERGNGLRYWGKLDEEVIRVARTTYNPREVVIIPQPSISKRIFAVLLGLSFINNSQLAFKK